jgi:deoxyribodipyrimidine photo-lyase
MQRDMRVNDNYALLYANAMASDRGVGLRVVYSLEDDTVQTLRHFKFLVGGLQEVESQLRERNIPLTVLRGPAAERVLAFSTTHKACALVTDFNPLRKFRERCSQVAEILDWPCLQVDARK